MGRSKDLGDFDKGQIGMRASLKWQGVWVAHGHELFKEGQTTNQRQGVGFLRLIDV